MNNSTAKLDMHNKISTVELETILKLQVETLKNSPEMSSKIPPLMVWGPPGAGKSSIIKKVAEDEGIDFIDFRLSQVEPVDLRGLPVPNKEDKSVEWFVTAEFPRDQKSRGILLFDEISAADRSLQVAAYELILDRRLGKLYKLPDGWLVVAAGNRTEDRAVSTTMSSALANRFMHVELDPSQEDWSNWAVANDIHPAVQGFIRYRPEFLFKQDKQNLERGWPSPRSWDRVSAMCKIYNNKDDILLRKIVYGLVGNSAGVEFMSFWKINEEFDNVLDYMIDEKKKLIIPVSSDRKNALVSAMTYLLWKAHDEKDQAARVDGFYRICLELTADFATMAFMAALIGKDENERALHSKILFHHKRYNEWSSKFGTAFKRYLKV